ncbi:hypothetical protein GGTG_08059 [Gaeumannomyces tritici R3-111a-1]|uniref:Major facilitator superfamily (MFS) profile domain-containing protein n=1 Tax=Gaeumannomyces tritici (strain R3-111a-1) TaxID=644352 RepID=J3P3H3_GAET3|nr:hypothetical protein GGTG_08059 [Gaeumannomyces tritici R3-111a-1]EJT74215.1 hypothetical protein GGTG_08059 [Gaeumannomyces tritici R3-111a-1]
MGLGILEDKVMDHVPGTTRYFDNPERPLFAPDADTGLKCDRSGPVPIILVPQPSDDPNDPLNWPLWRRDVITLILSLVATIAVSLGPILAANTVTLSLWFGVDFTKIALLTGYFLLGVGLMGVIFVPSSRIWGKRHAFVFGLIIIIISSAWAGDVGRNYDSMVGARVIQGFGAAPYEALVNVAVGDLYFVHERGKRMAGTNLAVFGGAFATPILVGKITHTIGWWWTFYLVAILCAASLPAIVFLCPEVAYRRDKSLNTDMLSEDERTASKPNTTSQYNDNGRPEQPAPATADAATNQARSGEEKPHDQDAVNPYPSNAAPQMTPMGMPRPVPRKKTFVESLALFDGRKTDDNFFVLFARPFVLFAQPAFFWACLIQGTMIGWTVFIGVILGQFFLGPPLWWNEVNTGYAYTGAFVGALVGFVIAGGLADWSAKKMTAWNGGVYEPEFRIVLIIPQLILGCAGLYGFGITADGLLGDKYHWSVPIAFFGLVVAGMVVGAVASSLYIVDAYRDLAIEGFTCMIIFKNVFSYALTYKAYDWIQENQTRATPVFNALATVQVVVCVLSIPMYIWGKRIRSFYHRHDMLVKLGLK